jgi:hypothetical protein
VFSEVNGLARLRSLPPPVGDSHNSSRVFNGVTFTSANLDRGNPSSISSPPDEPDPQDQKPHCQQEPGKVGEVDHGVGLCGLWGEHTERKKANAIRTATAGKARRTTHLIPSESDALST